MTSTSSPRSVPPAGPAACTRGATPAASPSATKIAHAVSNKREVTEFLPTHGYCSRGTSISMLHLSLLLHQATNALPRSAASKLPFDTFFAIAWRGSSQRTSSLPVGDVSSVVIAHLADSVEAAAAAQDAARTVSAARPARRSA